MKNEEIEYATAVNIKGARKKSSDEPLEMSLVQVSMSPLLNTLITQGVLF